MDVFNQIQSSILEMEGGQFQQLCDAYLYLKYRLNIITPGSMDGTHKTTAGTPDSYMISPNNGKYIMIMYGTRKNSVAKLKQDIEDVFSKSGILAERIEKIICCYGGNNIPSARHEELVQLADPCELEVIGLSTLSFELEHEFRSIAVEYCGVADETNQVYTLDEFSKIHDRSRTNAPISTDYVDENGQLNQIVEAIKQNPLVVITGTPGIGKTRTAIEALRCIFKSEHVQCLAVVSNGQALFSDLYGYVKSEQDVYIMLDDATGVSDLKSVLSLLLNDSFSHRLHFVVTVRKSLLSELTSFVNTYHGQVISLIPLSNDSLKEVLTQYLPEDDFLLDEVIERTNNNPRVGIIAARQIGNGKTKIITNKRPIMCSYYDDVLRQADTNDEQRQSLFIIAVFGRLKYIENEKILPLLDTFALTPTAFESCVDYLDKKEICTIVKNIAVGIEDQSIQDYVIYHYLFGSTAYSIDKMFEVLFKIGGTILVNVINKAFAITSDEATLKELRNAVSKFYRENSKQFTAQERIDFLKQFGMFLEVEVMDELDALIDNAKSTEDNITYEFKKFDGNTFYSSSFFDLLEIFDLTNYENAPLCIEKIVKYVTTDQKSVVKAVKLMAELIDYQPKLQDPYMKLRLSISELINATKNSAAIVSEMLFFVCRKLLSFHKDGTEPADGRTIKYWHGELNDESIDGKLRDQLWSIIFTLVINERIPFAAWKELTGKFSRYRESLKHTIHGDIVQMRKINTHMSRIDEFGTQMIEVDLLRADYLSGSISENDIFSRISYEQKVFWEMQSYSENNSKFSKINNNFSGFLQTIEKSDEVREFANIIVKMYNRLIQVNIYNEALANWLKNLDEHLRTIFFKTIFELSVSVNVEPLVQWAIYQYTGRKVLEEFEGEIDKNIKYLYTCLTSIPDPTASETLKFEELLKVMDVNSIDIIWYSRLPIRYRKNSDVIDSVLELMLKAKNFKSLYYVDEENAQILCKNCADIDKLKKVYLEGIVQDIDYDNQLLKCMPIDAYFVEDLFDMLEDMDPKDTIANDTKIISKIKALWGESVFSDILERRLFKLDDLGWKTHELNKIFESPSPEQVQWLMEQQNGDMSVDALRRIMSVVVANLSEKQALPFLINLDKMGYDYRNSFEFSPDRDFPALKTWFGSEVPMLEENISFLNDLEENVTRRTNMIYLENLKNKLEKRKDEVTATEFLQYID